MRTPISTNSSLKDINPCALFSSLLRGICGLGKLGVEGVNLEIDKTCYSPDALSMAL